MATKEQRQEYNKRYIEKHPEKYRQFVIDRGNRAKQRYKDDEEYRQKCLAYAREYSARNKDKMKARRKTEEYRLKDKKYREQNKHKEHSRIIKSKYGVDGEWYANTIEAQGGVCAICGLPESTMDGRWKKPRRLGIDHRHSDNKVRGLLCASCNHGIAAFKENTDIMVKAIQYLMSWSV